MKKNYLFHLMLILFNFSHAQGWERVFQDMYTGSFYGTQGALVATDGSILFVGYGAHPGATYSDGYVTKLDSVGNVIWSKKYFHSSNMNPQCIIEVNGGFLVSGSEGYPSTSFILKIDPSGNVVWVKNYSGAAEINVLHQSGNSVIIAGRVYPQGFYVAKIDGNGSVIWSRFHAGSWIYPKGIAPAENDGFVLVCYKESSTYGMGSETYVYKYDSSGNVQWSNSYSYAYGFTPNTIRVSNSGDYLIGGSVLMKLSKSGSLLWVKAGYSSFITEFHEEADNSLVLMTTERYAPAPFKLVKLDSTGTPLWGQTYAPKGNQSSCMKSIPGSGYILLGNYSSSNTSGAYLVKTNNNGISGCNTNTVELRGYLFREIQCVINPLPVATNYTISDSPLNFQFAANSPSVVNACCLAEPVITSDYFSCAGDSIHYFATGGPNYLWYNGATTNSIVTMDTIVTLTISNTCGSFSDTLCVHPGYIPTFTYTANKNTICSGDSVLVNLTGNSPYYYCSGPFVHGYSQTSYCLKPVKTTTYNLVAYTGYRGPGCSSSQVFTVFVTPDKPVITRVGDTLFSSSPSNNQWMYNGSYLSGETNQWVLATLTGSYSVKIVNLPCTNVSDPYVFAPHTIVYSRNAWQRMLGSIPSSGSSVLQTDDNDLIVAGTTSNNYSTKQDIVVVKTDRNGNVKWSKTYGGNDFDNLNKIIKVPGGYIGVGSTESFGAGNIDLFVIKFDTDGQIIWSKTYGDWNDQMGYAIEGTSDGSFIITGKTTNPHFYTVDSDGRIKDSEDLYLVKIDNNGNLVWSKTFDTGQSEYGISVHETAEGDFIVAGSTTDTQSKIRVYLLKTDSNGNLLWSKIIANAFFAQTAAMQITPAGDYLICTGASGSAYLLKTDPNGNVIWSKIAHVNTWGNSLAVTNDNAAVFTGGFGYSEGGLTKIDLDGKLLWSVSYGGKYEQYVGGVIQLNDGTFMMTGAVDTTNTYQPGRISLINTDSQGQINCSQAFTPSLTIEQYSYTPHTTTVSSLGMEKSCVTGFSVSAFSSKTLCRSASDVDFVNEIKADKIMQVYPNPSSGFMNVNLGAVSNYTRIKVYSTLGDCVYSESFGKSSSLQLDLTGRPKGLYIFEIITPSHREVKKIIIQ